MIFVPEMAKKKKEEETEETEQEEKAVENAVEEMESDEESHYYAKKKEEAPRLMGICGDLDEEKAGELMYGMIALYENGATYLHSWWKCTRDVWSSRSDARYSREVRYPYRGSWKGFFRRHSPSCLWHQG